MYCTLKLETTPFFMFNHSVQHYLFVHLSHRLLSVGRSVARNASSCLSTYLPPVRPRCREGRRHTSQYSILTIHICSERFARPARPISDLLSPITIKKRLLVEYSEFLCDIFPSMLYLHIPR